MRRALALAALSLLASACAERRVVPGPYKNGYAVRVVGSSVEQERKDAVSSFFELYMSSPAASQAALDEKVLSKPGAYIVREKQEKGALRALVQYARLGRDLDALGLVRPEGVKGKPKVLVSLRESGPGARQGEGRASESLRRGLLARGYTVIDASDPLNGAIKTDGSREQALAAAKKLSAEVVVWGQAAAETAGQDAMDGYGSYRARVKAEILSMPGATAVDSIDQEAGAVDVSGADAAAKALESAGELAGDKVQAALGRVYQQRVEFQVAVLGLGSMERAKQFLRAARKLPLVAGAALDQINGSDVKFRFFVERSGAEELTAELLRLKDFKLEVRSVEPDYGYVEFSSGEVF